MRKSHTEKPGKAFPYIFMLVFISGITVGAVFSLFSTSANIISVSSASKMTIFTNSFLSFLKPCIIIWVCGFIHASVYLSAATLLYRGGILGFAMGCILKNYGLGSMVCATLPQNIIFFPFLLFISLAAAGQKTKGHSGYITILVLAFIACAMSALIDTYITRFLIRFIL